MNNIKKMRTETVKFGAFALGLALVIFAGTAGFATIEGFSLVDSFYFSVVTITTVGFGDFHPVTPAGKALAIMLILMGVGTFTGMVASAAEMFLSRREMENRLEKLNMVIGAFYSEVGTWLLASFSDDDPQLEKIRLAILEATRCSDEDFDALSSTLRAYKYSVDMERVDLAALKKFLTDKRPFLLRLVENPTLLEHETFTDLLMAAFHLTEELMHRESFTDLPSSDIKHLAGDIARVYDILVHHWLDYMRYLKKNYPYLFSLAMRTNPFDQDSTPVVT